MTILCEGPNFWISCDAAGDLIEARVRGFWSVADVAPYYDALTEALEAVRREGRPIRLLIDREEEAV